MTQGEYDSEVVPETQQDEVVVEPGVFWMTPGELWFDHSSLARHITSVIQKYYVRPWTCYSQVDNHTKKHWFNLFKRTHKWPSEYDNLALHDYHEKAGQRLKDTHNYITSRSGGKRPDWLPEEVHKEMMRYATEDPEFLKKSERSKKNWRGGSLKNPIEPTHFQGSISTVEHAKKMAKDNGGALPTAGELYLRTHTKNIPGKGNVPCSSKAKQIKETYEKTVAECREKGFEKDPNQIFFETVGGRMNGKVHGLGSGSHLYYAPPLRGGGSSSSYVPSLYSQFQQQFTQKTQALEATQAQILREREEERLERQREKVELQREKEELQRQRDAERLERQREKEEKEENDRAQAKVIAELKEAMENYGRMFSQCSQFQSQDHYDPPGGGVGLGAPTG
ncbi:uncharacterized protein [Spinacia oleracea]|uniref:Uncharacterized protein n=1 Tax=Spinacia oleracea TaxID=3562 RepID=A0ABM3R1H6_SPIOL|nr:uncharacterized protein LOC130464096 [Spinacia oleracea]